MGYSTTIKTIDGAPLTKDVPYLTAIQSNMTVTIGDIAPPSTPSVMGHFLQFYNVVSSNGVTMERWGPLYTRYVDEWCALLAMLAIDDTKGYGIKFQEITLPSRFDNDNLFLSICGSAAIKPPVTPTSGIDTNIPGTSWDNMYTIVMNYDDETNVGRDEVLGITHPWTLVCPAKGIKTKEFANVLNMLKTDKDLRMVVLQWLARMKRYTYNATVTSLIQVFEEKLCSYDGHNLDADTKVNNAYRVKPASFASGIGEPENAFGRINFTMHKRVRAEEWYALFTALSLNDIRDYGIIYKNGNFVSRNNAPITKNDEPTFYMPLEAIDKNYGFGYAEGLSTALQKLSKFEHICLLGWLLKLETYSWSADAGELVFNLTVMKNALQDILQSHEVTIAANMQKSQNRFYVEDINDPFRFTVHKRNAAFFDAYDTEPLGIEIRTGWLNALSLLALKNVRELDASFSESNRLTKESDLGGCYTTSGVAYKRHELIYEGKSIASSSSAMLLEVHEGKEERLEKILASLKIYGHEHVLIACWLYKLLDRLTRSASVNKESGDYAKIVDIVEREITRLLGSTKDANITMAELRNKFFLGEDGFYNILVPDNAASLSNVDSAIKYFDHYIADNIFEPILITVPNKISDDGMKNSNSSTYTNQVYEMHEGREEPSGGLHYLLPFTDKFVQIIHNIVYESGTNGYVTSGVGDPTKSDLTAFSLDYVKAIYNDEDKTYRVSFKCQGDKLPHFEIQKLYKESMISAKRDNYVLGTMGVWPAIEIEGYRGYKLNHVTTGADSSKLSVPKANPAITASVARNNISIRGDSFNFISHNLTGFPRFLRIEHDGVSGLILNSPNSYVRNNARHGQATIAIDFGTSNTMVYVKIDDGNTAPLKIENVIGKLLTQRGIVSGFMLPAFYQVPPISDNVALQGDFFPTACYRILSETAARPLMNGNLYVFTLNEFAPSDVGGLDERGKSILDDRSTLITDLKMDDKYPNEMAVLFKQLILFGCIEIASNSGQHIRDINVRVSYPIALDREVRRIYEVRWKDAMEYAQNEIDFHMPGTTTLANNVTFFSESYCAAQAPLACYPPTTINSVNGYMVADIGGGTTDIVVVQGANVRTPEAMRIELSVKYAARYIQRALYLRQNNIVPYPLLDTLLQIRSELITSANTDIKNRGDFITIFGEDRNANKKRGELSARPEGKEGAILTLMRRILVNADTHYSSHDREMGSFSFDFERLITTFDQGLKLCKGERASVGETVAKLVQSSKYDLKTGNSKVKLVSAALFFFIGAIMKKFREKGGIYTGDINDILLSGNGTRTFEWLDIEGDALSVNEYLAKFYRMGRGDADGSKKVSIIKSLPHKRKHETAEGLLYATADAEISEELNKNARPMQVSSMMPDIGAVFKLSETKPFGDFLADLSDAFKGSRMSHTFKAKTVEDLKIEAQEAVNRDFNKPELLKEEIFRFLKAFSTVSRTDYLRLFEITDILSTDSLSVASDVLKDKIDELYNGATAEDRAITFPVHSANEYIVLALAMERVCVL